MRCPLTQISEVHPERGHMSRYDWRGHAITVCDSARNVLAVLGSFHGPDSVTEALTERFFLDFTEVAYAAAVEDGDYEQNMAQCICDALWDVCGIDATKERVHADSWEEPRFDWGEDADRIRASLLMAYSLEWDEVADRMSFAEVCGLLGSLMEAEQPTPFATAFRYRGEPPSWVKKNDGAMEDWRKAAEYFRLAKPEAEDAMAAANSAMDGMFAAAERAAGRG